MSSAPRAAAHADLLRADPAPDALLAAPPRLIEIWLTEPVASDAGDGALSIKVLDQSGRDVPVSDLTVDPNDQTHLRASVRGIATGTYTVVWSNRSATDGHSLSGSYAFRVASSTRAPGAATTEADDPAPWAIVTRWATFFGAALIAGGFGIGQLIAGAGETLAARRRRIGMAAFGAVFALAATLVEPAIQTWFPATGVTAGTMSDTLGTLPDAWWCRPVAGIIALSVAAWAARLMARGGGISPLIAGLGTAAGFGVLLGLSLTSHAAGRADWRAVALASNIVHQWAVALWVGGLVAVAIGWSARGTERGSEPIRRFSRLALVLALVGIGTGTVNAGFILPKLETLWSSTYGQILIIKVAIVVPVLALATFHRSTLRRLVDRLALPGATLRRTVRLETALIAMVVLGGSILALLAPPSIRVAQADAPTAVDLRQPILTETAGQETWVHLATAPGQAGTNRFVIALKQGDGTPATGDPPALVRLTVSNLDRGALGSAEFEAAPAANGTYTADATTLGLDGWWRADVTLRWLGRADTVLTYYLLLPDPNLHGMDAPADRPSDPAAAALYETAMVRYTGLHRVRYQQLMLDGRGGGVMSEHIVNDGSDGSQAGFIYRNITINGWEAIVFSDRMWQRRPGEAWEESEGQDMIPPARWGEEYSGATGFQLGRIEEIDGEPCQVLTFVVPDAPNRVIAWYVWWVGTETGQVRRDAMISRSHYMVSFFSDFDAPLTVAPPEMATSAG